MLSCGYTDEQKSIDAKLPELEKQIQNLQQAASNVDKFIGPAKKYTRITDLTPEILHIFVSKIIIHERRERFKQNTEQQIDISVTSAMSLKCKEHKKGERQAVHMHYLPFGARLNKGVFMGTLLNRGFEALA